MVLGSARTRSESRADHVNKTVPTSTLEAGPGKRVVVITGASGGIGSAIARKFAGAGYSLVLHAFRNGQAADALATSIQSSGGEATVITADLTDASDRARLVATAFSWRQQVDVWINNAGADVLTGAAQELDFASKLSLLWRTDVEPTLLLSRDVGRRMRRGGVILNVGWDQAATGMAGDSGEMFAATKGAIMAATRSLAKSFAPRLRVNCLAPGWIKTEWGEQSSEYWSERARREALRDRWGTPDDVAAAALFLASDDADFVTGHVLPINGGLSGYERWADPHE